MCSWSIENIAMHAQNSILDIDIIKNYRAKSGYTTVKL
jgi:hypothetical protein